MSLFSLLLYRPPDRLIKLAMEGACIILNNDIVSHFTLSKNKKTKTKTNSKDEIKKKKKKKDFKGEIDFLLKVNIKDIY